jgi:hypothetical protein
LSAINENSVVCSSLKMDIHHSIKFAADHVTEVTGVNGAVRRVPGQRANFSGVSLSVPVTEPRRCVTGFGIVVPDNRLTVFRALIGPLTKGDAGEHRQEEAANTKQSTHHSGC